MGTPDFDFSILRDDFDFPSHDVLSIAKEVSDCDIDNNAEILLNKSAIFFAAKLIASGNGAQEEEVAKILKKWDFERFDIDAKEKIKPDPLPIIQPIFKMNPSNLSSPDSGNGDTNEQSMQMKLMGLLKKKFQ